MHHTSMLVSKYMGPTNTQGTRIKVTCKSWANWKPVTVGYDYALGNAENHEAAFEAFMATTGWREWTRKTCALKDGDIAYMVEVTA